MSTGFFSSSVSRMKRQSRWHLAWMLVVVWIPLEFSTVAAASAPGPLAQGGSGTTPPYTRARGRIPQQEVGGVPVPTG